MDNLFPLMTLAIGALALAAGAQEKPKPAWPDYVRDIRIASTADGTEQPAMFYAPTNHAGPVPLLVSLHTWSAGYTQLAVGRAAWCRDKQWAFVHPHFRGPNNTPPAMGSDLAVQDILDAVEYAKNQVAIDTNRIYIVGFSGGGHAAMLMAGRAPDVWAGVSASCGISDLKKWHAQNPGYGRGIEAAAGGNPQQDANAAQECAHRSPVTWLKNARHIPMDIKAGIHDGHPGGGSVPVSQSLEAFNLLANPADRLSDEDIAFITREQAIPEQLQKENAGGRLLGRAPIHFQRQSGNVRITIFEGGHAGYDSTPWLALQRKGLPAVWDDDGGKPKTEMDEANVGK